MSDIMTYEELQDKIDELTRLICSLEDELASCEDGDLDSQDDIMRELQDADLELTYYESRFDNGDWSDD